MLFVDFWCAVRATVIRQRAVCVCVHSITRWACATGARTPHICSLQGPLRNMFSKLPKSKCARAPSTHATIGLVISCACLRACVPACLRACVYRTRSQTRSCMDGSRQLPSFSLSRSLSRAHTVCMTTLPLHDGRKRSYRGVRARPCAAILQLLCSS